jgi:hypothetical protein
MAPDVPDRHDRPLSRAAFLGGALGFVSLIALSLVGTSHARSLRGDAGLEFWFVVALVAAALVTITVTLARTPAASTAGDVARRIAVGMALVGIVGFVWETTALGAGYQPSPSGLLMAAFGS